MLKAWVPPRGSQSSRVPLLAPFFLCMILSRDLQDSNQQIKIQNHSTTALSSQPLLPAERIKAAQGCHPEPVSTLSLTQPAVSLGGVFLSDLHFRLPLNKVTSATSGSLNFGSPEYKTRSLGKPAHQQHAPGPFFSLHGSSARHPAPPPVPLSPVCAGVAGACCGCSAPSSCPGGPPAFTPRVMI